MEQDNGRENFKIGLDTTQLYSDAQGARAAFERLGTSAENVGRRIDQSLGHTDISALRRELADMRTAMEQTAKQAERSGESIDRVFSQLKATAASLGVAFSAKEMITTLATVRGKYQQYQMALETMLGSTEKAAEKMQEFAQLAAITPFGMDDVVQGAKQLMAYGIETDKVTDTMRRLGDVAAGLGLNLNDLAWLYGTTAVQGRLFTQDFRQFTGRGIPLAEELAKQFGVTKDKVQELVTAGKVGFPEVEKAIKAMTDDGGKFGGLMENQSKSITGRISNIEDTIEQAINDIGKQTEGAMYSALDGVTFVVEHWKEVGEAILAAAEAIGLYKAATVGIAAFQASAANIGYDAEIAQLATIIPQKEAAANADLQEAVASGKLTEAKAAQVAAMREEAAVRVQELEAKAKSAALTAKEAVEEYNAATAKAANASLALDEAQEKVEAAEHAYEAILQYGDAEAISTAEENLNSAAVDRNIAARNLQTARTEVGAAAKRVDATAQAASTAQNELHTASTNLDTAATTRDTAAKGLWAQVVTLCKRAQDAWNASMFSSPLFWIAAAIAGATYAIYKIVTAENAEEAAVRKTNEAWDEYNKKAQDRKQTIEGLIRTIQNETGTEFEKAEAYRELEDLAPSLTEKYSQVQLAAMDFGEAQKDLNEELDAEKIKHAREEVEKLEEEYMNLRNNNTATTASSGYISEPTTMLANNSEAERVAAKLDEAKKKYQELLDLQREAEENARPIEIRLQEAQGNEKITQKIFDFYDEAMVLASNWQAANETINFATGETRLDAFIAKARGELEDLHSEVEKNPLDVNLQMEEREKTKILNELLAWKANAEANGDTNVPLTFVSNYQTILAQLDTIKKKAAGLAADAAKTTTTYAEAYNAAKADRDTKQKKLNQIKSNKGAYTQKQYEDAVAEADAADEAFQKLGGSSIKSDTTAANKAADAAKKAAQKAAAAAKRAAEDAKRRRQQQAEEMRRWNEQQTKTEQEAANASADLDVARIKNEGERKREENRRQHEKNLQQIEKQADEYRKATFEHNKKLWEISNTDKTKSYEDTAAGKAGWKGLALSDDQQTIINAAKEKENLDYAKKEEEIFKELFESEKRALSDYLKTYGNFQEQRLAIAEEYAEKIAKAEKDGNRNEAMRLRAEQTRQLDDIDAKELLDSANLALVFEDFGMILSEPLKQTVTKLEEYTKSKEFKSRSLDEQKTIYDALDKAKKSLGETGAFKLSEIGLAVADYNNALIEQAAAQRAAAEATREYMEAEKKLVEAKKSGNTASIEQAQVEVSAALAKMQNAHATENNANAKVARTQNAANKSLEKFNNTLNKVKNTVSSLQSGGLSGMWEAFGTKLQNKIGAFVSGGAKLNKEITQLASTLAGSGKTIGEFSKSISKTLLSSFQGISEDSDVGAMIEDAKSNIGQLFSSVLGKDSDAFKGVQNSIGTLVSDAFKDVDLSNESSVNAAVGNLAGDIIGQLASKSSSGGLIGSIIGLIIQLLDSFAESGLGGFVGGLITDIGDAIGGILSSLLKDTIPQIVNSIGDLINGVVSGVANLITFGAVGDIGDAISGSNEAEVAETIERLTEANERLKKSIDDLKEEMQNQGGQKLLSTYQQAVKDQQEIEDNTREMLIAKMGYHSAHHSNASNWDWGESEYSELNKVLSDYARKNPDDTRPTQTSVSSLDEIYQLTPEQMNYIRNYASDIWENMQSRGKYDMSEYWEAYADLAGEMAELNESLKESLTQTSFQSMRNSFMESLMDMESDAEDFTNNFQEMLMRSVLNAQLSDLMDDELQAFYDKWAEYAKSDGELSQAEIQELQDDYEALSKKGLELREQASQITGYEGSDSDADSSAGAWSSLGEETGRALEGRFAALQIQTTRIADIVAAQYEATTQGNAQRTTVLSEMNNLVFMCSEHLERIAKNTDALPRMEKKLESIKTNTDRL